MRSDCESGNLRESRFATIGYSGRSLEVFIQALIECGVTTLLDVRHFPGSRFRPEFSKTNLADALNDHGIQYLHKRDLGIPSKVRREHGYPEHTESLWSWYDSEVLSSHIDDLSWFPRLESGLAALMCVESDPADCHRYRLGKALESRGLSYAGDL